MGYYDYSGEYVDDNGYPYDSNPWDPWGDAGGSGQVGSPGSQWAGDSGSPYTDEYWDDIYGGGGIPDPASGMPTWSVTGTGYDDDPGYYGFNDVPAPNPDVGEGGGPTFVGGDIAMNPVEPIPSDSPDTLTPPEYGPFDVPIGREYDEGYTRRPPVRDTAGNIINPKTIPPSVTQPKSPAQQQQQPPKPGSNTVNLTNLSHTATPGITSDVPDPRVAAFNPQQLPQNKRPDSPVKSEILSGGFTYDPKQDNLRSSYDPNEMSPMANAGFPGMKGAPKIPQAGNQPQSVMDALKQGAKEMSGVNRYAKLIDDAKNKRWGNTITDILTMGRR